MSAEQLDRLLSHLEATFSYEFLLEFTVEAGRPDSITREKLDVLKRHKIPRISINPQTMQQKTLDLIGRRHTVEDILRVYGMARELEFENINMDLIAGLPGETVEDFEETLEVVRKVRYDSAFTFIYSKRTGSPAAARENQVPEEVGKERFDRLLAEVQAISAQV